jgi:hypothetical protein
MYSLAPVIDLLAGLTYMRDGDSEAAAADTRNALASVEGAAASIERCLAAMARLDLDGSNERTRLDLAAAASELAVPLTAAAFSAAYACVDRWAAENPVSMLIKRTRELPLNAAIRAVEPTKVEPGGEVTLLPFETFPVTQPQDVAVFTEDGREPAQIVRWDAQQVVVTIGPRARSGHVFFGPALAASDDPVVESLRAWERAYADEWQMTMFPLLRSRSGLRRPAYCDPSGANHLEIDRPPVFASVNLLDASGVVLEDLHHAVRGRRPYSLEWRVHFPQPGTSVRLLQGDRILASGLPPAGSQMVPVGLYDLPALSVAVEEDGDTDEKLAHRYLWDEEVAQVASTFVEPTLASLGWVDLDCEPRSLHLGVHTSAEDASGPPFSYGELRIVLREPSPAALTLTINSSDGRVSADPDQVVIPTGGRSAVVTVSARGYDRDRPEEPCATLEVRGSDDRFTYGGRVEVWVEPLEGKWELVGVVGEVDPDVPGVRVRLPGHKLGLVGIHAALLENDQILFFAPTADFNNQEEVDAELWDWRDRRVLPGDARPPASFRQRNLFCAGHVHLSDGRLLIAGGHSFFGVDPSTDWFVHVYDPGQPSDRRWTRYGRMQEPRWYPTLLALPDGRVLIVSGSSHGAYFNVSRGWVGGTRFSWFGYYGWLPGSYGYGPTPLGEAGSATAIDVFDPAAGGLVRFPGRFLDANQDTYPLMAVLPSGPYAPSGATLTVERNLGHLHRIELTSTTSPVTHVATYVGVFRSRRTFPTYGAGVLLPLDANARQARYLVVGGGNELDPRLSVTSPATNTIELFEYDSTRALEFPSQVGFRDVGQRLAARRFMSDAVLLADGNVLICGGAGIGTTNENEQPVKLAELFDATTERLRPMDTASIERRYHATHLLLPDGTVQASGSTGGMGWPEVRSDKYRVEIFRPPYLWRGRRPLIGSAPVSFPYAGSATIESPQAYELDSAALVRLGSVTHANNMDQRYVRLPITGRSVTELDHSRDSVTVSTPRDGSIAPPGPYMLFLVDRRGVPSPGRMVRVGVPGRIRESSPVEPPAESAECARLRGEILERRSRTLDLFTSMEGLDPQDERDRAEIRVIYEQVAVIDAEIASRLDRAASLGCRA